MSDDEAKRHGLVEVSREQFFATVGQMNVHPCADRMCSVWETPDRRVMGITTPGYLCIGETAYFARALREGHDRNG